MNIRLWCVWIDTCYDMAKAIYHGNNVADSCMESREYQVRKEKEKSVRLNQEIRNLSGEIHRVFQTLKGSIERVQGETQTINELNNGSIKGIETLRAKINDMAARAGQAGRGFAVVAQEVRELATNSQESVSASEQNGEQIKIIASNLIHVSGETEERVLSTSESGTAINTVVGEVWELSQQVNHLLEQTENMSEQL